MDTPREFVREWGRSDCERRSSSGFRPSRCSSSGYGVAKSTKQEFNRKRLEKFLAGPILVLPFEDADAPDTGSVRASHEAMGKPIGAYDLLIAGQALRHHLTLVTANVREFSRVKGAGLAWYWAKP